MNPSSGDEAITVAMLGQEFHALGAEIELHRVGMSRAGARRRGVVRELQARGLGYGQIAKLLGVSKSLIQQMARVG